MKLCSNIVKIQVMKINTLKFKKKCEFQIKKFDTFVNRLCIHLEYKCIC